MIINNNKLRDRYTECVINGGITLNNKANIPNNLRFISSIEGYENKILLQELTYDIFAKFWLNYSITEKELFGVWINKGVVYFDKSLNFNSIIQCVDFAIKNNQLAIYDNVLNKEIVLRYKE